MANEVSSSSSLSDMVSDCLIKENSMNQVANETLQQFKQTLANPTTHEPAKPTTPDFTKMSCLDATRWCKQQGIEKPQAISTLTGKPVTSIYTAMWKLKHPKRSKKLNRLSKQRMKDRAIKIELIKDATKGEAKPTTVKTTKPKIENGLYDDGMETPFLDAIKRTRFNFLDEEKQPLHELLAENRRLRILVDHYESILFKGGK